MEASWLFHFNFGSRLVGTNHVLITGKYERSTRTIALIVNSISFGIHLAYRSKSLECNSRWSIIGAAHDIKGLKLLEISYL